MGRKLVLLYAYFVLAFAIYGCNCVSIVDPYKNDRLKNVTPIPTVTPTPTFDEKVRMRLEAKAKEYGGEIIRDESAVITNIPSASSEGVHFPIGMDLACFTTATSVSASSRQLYKDRLEQWNFPGAVTRMRSDLSGYAMCDFDEYRVFLFMDPYYVSHGYPVITGNVLIMRKVFTYSDFEQIKVGDKISDVEAVDDACKFYIHSFDEDEIIVYRDLVMKGLEEEYYSSVHYLEEGLLRIVYGDWDENYEPVITSITLYPDYLVDTAIGRKQNYKINPLDIPNKE